MICRFASIQKPAALKHSSQFIVAVFAIVVAMVSAHAKSIPETVTNGGAGGTLYEVTNLHDGGPGSLRAAIEAVGPRTIVFKVGGEIWLNQPLIIKEPNITIAGETAPSPGISLMGDTLRIRGHDVIVRHLRVRVGARAAGSPPENRDGISVNGSDSGLKPAYSILIENCSVAWAIDENVSIYGPNSHDIVIRNSIIAEGLHRSIHPKGLHSTGLLIGPRTHNILVQGNLIASNQWRNPAIAPGASAVIANNLIHNPGGVALHYYARNSNEPFSVAAVGNVVQAGPNTKPVLLSFKEGLTPGTVLYYKDNLAQGTKAFDVNEPVYNQGSFQFAQSPPLWFSWLNPLPAQDVREAVLNNVGARPWDRDKTDLRIISEVRQGTGKIPNEPTDPRLLALPSP